MFGVGRFTLLNLFFFPQMLTTEVSALYLPKWEDLALEKYIANPFKVSHVDESDRVSM